jgi:Fe-S-cluster containining protein
MGFEYPKNVRFKCERCALCCGDTEHKIRNILLMEPEAQHISGKTSAPVCEFADRVKGFEPYVYRIKKTREGKCMFLKGNLCSIYGIRPLVCMFYPFELKESSCGKHVFSYTDECPCINQGAVLRRDYFEGLFKRLADLAAETNVDTR